MKDPKKRQSIFHHCHSKMKNISTKKDSRLNGYASLYQGNDKIPRPQRQPKVSEEPSFIIGLQAHLSYCILGIFGYLRYFLQLLGVQVSTGHVEHNRKGYAQLYKSYDNFLRIFIYGRIEDCWNKPICSRPGTYVDIIKEPVDPDYRWNITVPTKTVRILNMGSYNYLGFSEDLRHCSESVVAAIRQSGVGVCSTRQELGTSSMQLLLEKMTAHFLGTEDCLVVGMGFATNATCIPTLIGRGSLILSDEFNHASIILGSRISGAIIRPFKHNNMLDLEAKLRHAITNGQPRTKRPWRKIIIFTEGIYSMEGTITNLPEIIKLKKKYKAYLYVDEAHSIGSLGNHGRGVVDYYGCNPTDIDILMGTFTKSFSAAGGYLAGSKRVINHIRRCNHNFSYATSMSPPVVQQIISTMEVIMNHSEGQRRIDQLASNTRFFRDKLRNMGFIVLGSEDSPVVPLLICFPAKLAAFSRMLEDRGVATVVVGFPATHLLGGRARFCLSAGHTIQMLEGVLKVVDEIGDKLYLKYSRLIKVQNVD